jgi:hypothetical protein
MSQPEKAKDLVEKLLGEEGDYPPGAPGRMARGETTNQAGEKVAGDFQRPDDETADDVARREAGEDDDDDDRDPEERFAEELDAAISETIEGARVRTFADVGVMTNNQGLVVRTSYGEFQVTIVRSR